MDKFVQVGDFMVMNYVLFNQIRVFRKPLDTFDVILYRHALDLWKAADGTGGLNHKIIKYSSYGFKECLIVVQ